MTVGFVQLYQPRGEESAALIWALSEPTLILFYPEEEAAGSS
jgi:hypothetical protein